MQVKQKVLGWMFAGSTTGSFIAFLAGFFCGLLQNLLVGHALPASGFHALKQHVDQPKMAVLPWILFWTLGYSLGVIANRAFDCSANPSCIAYPAGPFGGGGGGGW